MQRDIMPKRTTAYSLSQSTVSTNRDCLSHYQQSHAATGQEHTMLFLPSWLNVLPMLYFDLCAYDSGTQRAGWDRPVKEERQALMSGRQQEELKSGLQQQDAIWPKSRQLPEINAIPSVSLSLFNNNSLSSFLLHEPRLPSFFCGPLPALLTTTLFHFVLAGSVSTVPLQALSLPYLCLSETAPLCHISVSCCLHLPLPLFPLSLLNSCPASQ